MYVHSDISRFNLETFASNSLRNNWYGECFHCCSCEAIQLQYLLETLFASNISWLLTQTIVVFLPVLVATEQQSSGVWNLIDWFESTQSAEEKDKSISAVTWENFKMLIEVWNSIGKGIFPWDYLKNADKIGYVSSDTIRKSIFYFRGLRPVLWSFFLAKMKTKFTCISFRTEVSVKYFSLHNNERLKSIWLY